jgi:septal ring factor EnvC (AmiA/AmiB activator)
VARAAIQGLNRKLEEKLEQKETEITELKAEMAELKRLVGSLTQTLTGGKP